MELFKKMVHTVMKISFVSEVWQIMYPYLAKIVMETPNVQVKSTLMKLA